MDLLLSFCVLEKMVQTAPFADLQGCSPLCWQSAADEGYERKEREKKKEIIAIELCSKGTRQRPRCSAAHFRGGSVYPCLFNLQVRPSCTVKLKKKKKITAFFF